MMKDKVFENKINRDVDKAKKDLAALGEDGVTGVSRIIEQLADDTKKISADAVKSFNKGIGQGLSQYNEKVQDVADKVPGNLGKMAAGYPWVAMTMTLAFSFLLGVLLLKPGR